MTSLLHAVFFTHFEAIHPSATAPLLRGRTPGAFFQFIPPPATAGYPQDETAFFFVL